MILRVGSKHPVRMARSVSCELALSSLLRFRSFVSCAGKKQLYRGGHRLDEEDFDRFGRLLTDRGTCLLDFFRQQVKLVRISEKLW